MKSGKWQMIEGIELPNQERMRTLGEKETNKYLGILEADTIKQVEIKKIWKIASQENEKTIRNQTTKQKSHQKDKHLGCSPCKILWAILELDKGRTSTNGPENKKTNDNKALPPNDDIDYMSQEKKEKEDSSAFKIASMHRYDDRKTT